MLIQSCPLIAFGETTPELSSQSQNKIQPQNSSGVETSTPECSGVRGSTARPCIRGGTGSIFTEPGRIRVFKKFQNRAGYTRSVEKLVNDQCSKQ